MKDSIARDSPVGMSGVSVSAISHGVLDPAKQGDVVRQSADICQKMGSTRRFPNSISETQRVALLGLLFHSIASGGPRRAVLQHQVEKMHPTHIPG